MKEIEYTEEYIQNNLRRYFLSAGTKRYEMFGRYVYGWESDYLAITKAGYVYECEVKISRGDFFNDFKKERKHLILESTETKEMRPNYMYYAVPPDLVKPDEVPNGYGLIYVYEHRLQIVKVAKLLHKEKADIGKLNLIDKFYWCMWDYMDKYRKLDVNKLKKKIKKLEKTIEEYDDMLSLATSEIEELKKQIENR